MGFYERAWDSAAAQYGANRAEKWGALARAGRVLQWLAIVALVIGIVVVWQGR